MIYLLKNRMTVFRIQVVLIELASAVDVGVDPDADPLRKLCARGSYPNAVNELDTYLKKQQHQVGKLPFSDSYFEDCDKV